MSSASEATLALLAFAAGGPRDAACWDSADVAQDSLRKLQEEGLLPFGAGLDLRGLDLSKASLKGAILDGVDLREATLTDVRGSGMSLRGAQLEGAKLSGIDLVGADLSEVSAGEATFARAMLEDAHLNKAQLRFADFTDAVLDGTDLSEADLWGVQLSGADAERTSFRGARLDESQLVESNMAGADFSGATMRRANLQRVRLQNCNLQHVHLDGSNLAGANLAGASLPNISLIGCDLTGASFSGAWLERTRMRAGQVGPAVGEEHAGNLPAAIDSYVVLERNFLSLGLSEDAGWAYLRRRRVGRRLHGVTAKSHFSKREWRPALVAGFFWLSDTLAEWLCNYGESLLRVARAFACIMLGFALLYWLTGSLEPREGLLLRHTWAPLNYFLFSLDSMTTVGTSEVALQPSTELGVLLSSLQTVLGTILLGLFGFVLGARIRS